MRLHRALLAALGCVLHGQVLACLLRSSLLLLIGLLVCNDPIDNFVYGLRDFETLCAQLLESIRDLLHLCDAANPPDRQIVNARAQKLCLWIVSLVDRKHLRVRCHPEYLLEHLVVLMLAEDSLEDEPVLRGGRLRVLGLCEQVLRDRFDRTDDQLSVECLELCLLDMRIVTVLLLVGLLTRLTCFTGPYGR